MLESYTDVLEIDDICKILKIGRKTAYSLLKNGEIRHRRIGRVYKISKEELIKYIENK